MASDAVRIWCLQLLFRLRFRIFWLPLSISLSFLCVRCLFHFGHSSELILATSTCILAHAISHDPVNVHLIQLLLTQLPEICVTALPKSMSPVPAFLGGDHGYQRTVGRELLLSLWDAWALKHVFFAQALEAVLVPHVHVVTHFLHDLRVLPLLQTLAAVVPALLVQCMIHLVGDGLARAALVLVRDVQPEILLLRVMWHGRGHRLLRN
mmetsp:Transcript_10601/g.20094  ORF Transcript_10601/g.20094 Transcript_10601/m.20094 type:complete len:209 (+) Transcript_10601:143-769(+)